MGWVSAWGAVVWRANPPVPLPCTQPARILSRGRRHERCTPIVLPTIMPPRPAPPAPHVAPTPGRRRAPPAQCACRRTAYPSPYPYPTPMQANSLAPLPPHGHSPSAPAPLAPFPRSAPLGPRCDERGAVRAVRLCQARPFALQEPHRLLHLDPQAGECRAHACWSCVWGGGRGLCPSSGLPAQVGDGASLPPCPPFPALPLAARPTNRRAFAHHMHAVLHCTVLQVSEHRLPKTYDYHRFPAPFIQVGRPKGGGARRTRLSVYTLPPSPDVFLS